MYACSFYRHTLAVARVYTFPATFDFGLGGCNGWEAILVKLMFVCRTSFVSPSILPGGSLSPFLRGMCFYFRCVAFQKIGSLILVEIFTLGVLIDSNLSREGN